MSGADASHAGHVDDPPIEPPPDGTPIDRSPGGAVRRTIRHPVTALRAWRALPPNKQARANLVVSGALPGPVRRFGWRVAGRLAGLALRRGGDGSIAAPIRAMARWSLGAREEALRIVELAAHDLGPRTAVRLAAVATAVDRPAVAARALAGRPITRGRDWAMAAEIAFRTGRFAEGEPGSPPSAASSSPAGVRGSRPAGCPCNRSRVASSIS